MKLCLETLPKLRRIAWTLVFGGLSSGLADGSPKPARPEWRMELVAATPAVRHPSVVAAAPDGRIFVAEDPMDIATERSDTDQGRIVCLHPDGRRTVFVDHLFAVFGLQYLEGRLYVLHNPKFSAFDDVGDHGTNRLELIEQTNPNWSALGWNDHVPANFRLGMDGYFYVATGDKGLFNATGRDGARISMSSGGLFRLRPDGTGLEVFCTGVRNILDVAVNAEDEFFTYDNTDEHEWMGRLTHMIEGGFYGYPHDFIPRQPYTLWCFADFGPGAATGAFCYTEDALPAEFRDNLFVADFGKRQVLRVPLTRAGGSWKVKSSTGDAAESGALRPNPVAEIASINAAEPLFVDPPEDFRPVGLTLMPDGRSILICDWQHRDSKDTNAVCGRLWKLTWTGPTQGSPKPAWFLPATLGKPFQASDADLLEALSSPSREVRMCAQRNLERRAAAETASARDTRRLIDGTARPAGTPPNAVWHQIWLQAALTKRDGSGLPPRIQSLLTNAEASVCRQAIRVVGEFRWPEAITLLSSQLTNGDRSIRRVAATALGRIGSTRAIPALVENLADEDLFARFAAFTALNRIGRSNAEGSGAWRQIATGLTRTNAAIRDGTAFAVRETFNAALLNELALLARDGAKPEESRVRALQLAASLHRRQPEWGGEWGAYHPFRTPPPAKTVGWEGTPIVLRLLRDGLSDAAPRLRRTAIEGLVRAGETNAASEIRQLFGRESDPATKAAALAALGKFRDREAAPLIAGTLDDSKAGTELISAALTAAVAVGGDTLATALGRFLEAPPRDLTLLTRALDGIAAPGLTNAETGAVLSRFARFPDRDVQLASVRALGRVGGPEAFAVLPALARDASLEIRRAALQAMAVIPGGAMVPQLLEAAAQPELREAAVNALIRVPDLRALELYLDALASRSMEQRNAAAKAITRLRAAALRAVEGRVPSLPGETVAQLQEIYRDEPGAQGGPIFSRRLESTPPAAYLDFALAHPGIAARGRKLFVDAQGMNCIGCHRVDREGGEVGPDLSGIGAQSDRRALAESVLFPNRIVREGYQAVQVETNDGEEITGLIKGETAELLTLRDATGALRQLPRRDIKSRVHLDRSLMPEGMQTALSLDDFADLIAYLASLRGVPVTP